MGASSSRPEDDKALQLCRERKKFVKQALNGRCSLAAAHFTYIQSLRNIGSALRKFAEPEVTSESSLYTSTTAASEPPATTDKSLSHFSISSTSLSRHVDATETLLLTPSPPNSARIHANFMKTGMSSSTTVEERPFPSIRTLRSSSSTPHYETPQSTERPQTPQSEDDHLASENSPWDYFGLHPIDRQFSFQEVNEPTHGFESVDDINRLRQEEGIPELEEEKVSFFGEAESEDSDDEFEEPTTDKLVQKFENRRISDPNSINTPSSVPSARDISSKTKDFDGEKNNSLVTPFIIGSGATPTHEKETPDKEPRSPNNVAPKDFLSSIKEIEHLFLKASDCGKEVPRMLEANKMHFRPIFPGKEVASVTSTYFKACFSCGEDPTHVPEEPSPTEIKYLTWHRTASSRSSSSRNFLGSTPKDDIEDFSSNIFESFCMNSGSHASTLDRLYAWERKLYDEVKGSAIIRKDYDMKCKLLREQESAAESRERVDKTRAIIKDLYSRIRVAIHRIDSISKRIEEIRDKELQPQLEELIEGLSRMWEKMFECHKLQFNIIKVAYSNGSTKISIQSESHRQATIHLEYELKSFSSSFTKWIIAQKSYVQSINGWLHKCVSLQQKTSRRKRRVPDNPLRNLGPPIYGTCGDWLDKLEALPSKEVTDSIKALAIMTTHFLPRQEKKQGSMNLSLSSTWMATNQSEVAASTPKGALEDWNLGVDRFQTSLLNFLEHLNSFASFSMNMYRELENTIEKAKERERHATY
ncbi:BZIP transcription factor, putative (DUF630 and DUF632) [Thalictrum thalictroides]|uniref:BZIP transcription factor, putative (DUF630 and DUF632) n=1 Tax=Thalictrum thalictroides TaxID=46969 RepID=A0A7J6URQ4_THATH|nr:BZIP transcription factor, putative (DUF630 and DUF632) [Thalictrum thalictroides]